MKILKHRFLTGTGKSSLNLFLVLPIFICFSLGCICSGSADYQGCATADGETLVVSDGSKLHYVKHADGAISETRPIKNSAVLCGADSNEVIGIVRQVKDKNREYEERIAVWQNSPREYKLANDEFFEKHTGFIQNRYFVSSSRGYVVKSRKEGTGKNSRTVNYRVYTQPQVFTLDDSVEGGVKSHHISREKLGLPESVYYDDLRFYPLGLSAGGRQSFAVLNNNDRWIKLYELDLFSGDLKQIFDKRSIPGKQSYENVTFDKSGKFVAYVLSRLNEKSSIVKSVNILNLEKDELILNREFADVSFSNGNLSFIFDENGGGKLGIFATGYRQTNVIRELIVFDLENKKDVAEFKFQEIFKDPERIQTIFFKNSDFLLTHTHKVDKTVNEKKTYLSRLNTETGQIIWDVELPE